MRDTIGGADAIYANNLAAKLGEMAHIFQSSFGKLVCIHYGESVCESLDSIMAC